MTATTEEKNPDESTWDPKLGIYYKEKAPLHNFHLFTHGWHKGAEGTMKQPGNRVLFLHNNNNDTSFFSSGIIYKSRH
jgi:hypothetical protein